MFVGDFTQLPPVIKTRPASMTEINLMEIPDCPFIDKGLAFESDMWAEGRFEMVELKKPFRQSEQSFIAALNDIREGRGDTAATRALVRQCAGSPASRGSTGGMTRTRSSTRSRRSHSNSGSGGGGGGGSSSSSGGGGGVGGDENGIKPTLLFPKNKSVDAENERELDKLGGVRGCAFCGGLGHRITDCPKRDKNARQLGAGQRDMLLGGGGYGGEY